VCPRSAQQAAAIDAQERARQVELELAAMRQRRDEAREDAAAERRRREDAQAAVSAVAICPRCESSALAARLLAV
jgi:hypothetical protein